MFIALNSPQMGVWGTVTMSLLFEAILLTEREGGERRERKWEVRDYGGD